MTMTKLNSPEPEEQPSEPVPNPSVNPEATEPDLPKEELPPPPIVQVIYELKKENLNAAFSRIAQDLQSIIDNSGLIDKYNFLFLYDERSPISERTANKLYEVASGDFADKKKPSYLLLHTTGGLPVPAYLISRYLKASPGGGFVAVIPRRAKSAGTLIALGAKEIHMGMMSELGPVDPQISDQPALGLGSALEYIAGVCEKHPKSAEMLSKYLQGTLNIQHLGLFERISESATHYAEKLLRRDSLSQDRVKEVAKRLVYGYKDHSFAIDCDEIRDILGEEIVKIETQEYVLANLLHQYLERVNLYYWVFHDKYCSVVGRAEADDLNLSDCP